MNPQPNNNDPDELKPRLNQLPPARDAQQINVPPRPATPPAAFEDIDDSAFNIGRETPPVVHIAAAAAPDQQPKASVPPPPPRPPVELNTPAPAATPAPVMPPATPPAVPQLVEPQPNASLPPVAPVTQPISPASPTQPVSAAIPPASAVSFQPASHTASDIVERIDETPQQNSSDIEELIARNHRLRRLKSFASFLMFVAGVVIAAFLINQFIFQSYYVDGTSMTPTLQNNDRLIIDKVEHTWANIQGKAYIPERGQIVVLDSSIIGTNGTDEQLVKRVIGLPGDTISIADGVVTIKNKDNPDGFDVNKKLGLNLQPTYSESPIEVKIGDSQVFVMGDNRVQNGSYDSRAFGPIDANKIIGRLWARILPLDKAQIF